MIAYQSLLNAVGLLTLKLEKCIRYGNVEKCIEYTVD